MGRNFRETTRLEDELGVTSSARMMPLYKLPNSYVVMDLETTGLSPTEDGILEIGAVKVIDGEVVDEFHTMVDTEKRMKAAARKVNGITRPMLKGAPKTAEAVSSFIEFSDDLPMMGHNANKFDRKFVEHAALEHLGLEMETEWIDTIELAREIIPERGYRLADLCERFGITNDEAHRALSDARATNECYQHMRNLVARVSTDSRDLPEPAAQGPLAGEVVCLTGNPYDPSKREVMEAIAAAGGTLSNNMTKKVTMLVNLEGDETTKVKRAKELAPVTGVRIVEVADLYPTIGMQHVLDAIQKQERDERISNRIANGCLISIAVALILLLATCIRTCS